MAWELSERGVGVHLVPLGRVALQNALFFEYVTKLTGGSHTAVARAGDVVEKLPRVRLDRLAELTIVNRTTAAAARDLRIFADGSFDAIVSLGPGRNEIVFSARDVAGEEATVSRVLGFDDAPPRTLEAAQARREALDRFAERMRVRAAESALREEIERARAAAANAERTLRIERRGDSE